MPFKLDPTKAILPDAEPHVVRQKCVECNTEFPLTSKHFKPNYVMASGFGKRCYECLGIIRKKKRKERQAAKLAKRMADIQTVLNTSKYGCPVQSELLALLTAKMGGLEVVATHIANDWMGSEPGTSAARRFQEMYLKGIGQHTDRVGSKTDIHNMSTDQIRAELDKKIRQAISGVVNENGVLKMPPKIA